jgi:hypothetical protein
MPWKLIVKVLDEAALLDIGLDFVIIPVIVLKSPVVLLDIFLLL